MRVRVLGPIEVEHDGELVSVGGPQQRRLLALLVAQRGKPLSNDRLVDALWPGDVAPEGATRSMRTYLSRLRAVLPDGILTSGQGGYALELDGSWLDANEFDRLIGDAERSVPDRASELYGQAIALWRGDPFGEFTSEWWALPISTRLIERRFAADIGRASAQMAMGHHNRAIPDLEALVAEHRHDERPVTMLMQALRATGRQAEALRVGRSFRVRLADETGLKPSPELAQLESAIASGSRDAEASVGRPLRGYTIHDPIGEGAYGRVYVATQPGTGRRVAIKAIRPDLADSTEFILRFDAEAQLVARLEHPHIVPLYDYWREPGGAYLVFRLLPSGTARDSVVTGGPWSVSRVSRLVEEIGTALVAAHAAGVVHNDVKTSNVLLDDEGAAYLTDFGIAVATGAADVTVDVRGLGWTAWELLTASPRPRNGHAPTLVGRVASVPDGLDAVLRTATAGGYGSVAELLLGWRASAGTAVAQSPLTSSGRQAVVRALTSKATAGVNPYRGLRPFDEADAANFHGRGAAVAELLALVDAQPFVTVVGSSGSGKSSVVRAGLLPELRHRGNAVVSTLPGDDPVGALRVALTEVATVTSGGRTDPSTDALGEAARRLGRLVVVVDQFEECWTRAPVERRDRFLDIISGCLDDDSIDVRFVATVRADLLDRPLEHPAVGQRVGAGSFVLAPLSPAELEEAIVSPSLRAGVTFDDGVVADLVAETTTQPGSLPLLQFTLAELYDCRSDGVIGRAALDAIGGGIAGAIGRRAEEIYATLDETSRADARSLFTRLVTPGEGAPDTRRRARYGELSPGMREVAGPFVAARLLVADRDPTTREPTIEVAHEALLGRWSRLVVWVDEDRRWLAQLQHLSTAARAWDATGRSDAELYRGVRLEAAVEALDVDGRTVSELERAFVEAGRAARDADVVDARRTARRLRRRLTAVAIALVAALIVGVVALVQRSDARRARGEAEDAERAARIEALIGRADSLRATQRDVAALLAVEAFRLADTPRTRSALLSTFTDDVGFLDAHRTPGAVGGAGIVMPDGASAYLVDPDGQIRPYELDTGSLGEALPGLEGAPDGTSILAASADGRLLAHVMRADLADGPSTVGVYDTATATLRFPPVELDGAVWSATFIRNHIAVAIGEEARLVVLDVDSGVEVASAPGVAAPAGEGAVAMEPQAGDVGPVRRPSAVAGTGDELLLGSPGGSLRVFDAATFELRRTVELPSNTLSSIRPLDDGTLLTAGRRGVARVDLSTGRDVWRHEQGVSAVGDGSSPATCSALAVVERRGTFYCGNSYGRLAEHDLNNGFAVRVLDAQNGNSGTLWPARDGTELVSFGDNERVVSRWRLDGSGPITHLVAPGFRGWRFNPRSDLLIVERGGFPDYLSQVVDAESGELVRTLDGLFNSEWLDDDTVTGVIATPDGAVETAHVDLDGGAIVADGLIVEPPFPVSGDLEPGKHRMLVRWVDGAISTLRQFDPRASRLGPAIEIEGYVSSAISQSGHRIAVGTGSGVVVYDGFTGARVGAISGTDLRGVFITPTDQLFVSSLGGELTRYDLDTLQPMRSLGAGRGFVIRLYGTADGSLIATNGGDHNVILYDVASGVRLGTPISIADAETNWIALSLDGRWLSVGGEGAAGEHASQVWDLDPATWVAAACRVAGRNLTSEEWVANLGDLAAHRATCPELPFDG